MGERRNRAWLRASMLALLWASFSGVALAQGGRPLPACVGIDARTLPDARICSARWLPAYQDGRGREAFADLIVLSDARRDAEKLI